MWADNVRNARKAAYQAMQDQISKLLQLKPYSLFYTGGPDPQDIIAARDIVIGYLGDESSGGLQQQLQGALEAQENIRILRNTPLPKIESKSVESLAVSFANTFKSSYANALSGIPEREFAAEYSKLRSGRR